jgi:NADPH-dependent ferric siderophore reductase
MGASAVVAETVHLSARFQRVVLCVRDPVALRLPCAPDAAVGINFPGMNPPAGRTYTLRDVDWCRQLVTVDVVLHGRGVGADWARAARPGDELVLDHANSWYRPPPQAESQVLIADLAGFPALAGVIEGLAPDAAAVAIVEVLDHSDLDYLPQRSNVELVTSVGSGNGAAPSALSRLLMNGRAPIRRGYCWFAGEAGEGRVIRKYLRHELHWAMEQLDIMGYWRHNSTAWDRRYAQLGPSLFAEYQAALAAGMPEKDAAEKFDLALERAGL